MIKWCAYCLHFIREEEPFDDFQISHGVCTACFPKVLTLTAADQEALKGFQAFYRTLQGAARQGRPPRLGRLLAESRALGLTTQDLLIGLLQPLLVEIGEGWADGRVTVAAEHRFSSLAADLLARLRGPVPLPQVSPFRRFLLVNVPGNAHVLGLRMAEVYLAGQGWNCTVLEGPTLGGLLERVSLLRPEVLGFSAAMPGQFAFVDEAAALLAESPHRPRHLLVGGAAVRRGGAPEPSQGIRAIRQLQDLNALFGPRVPEASSP